MKLHPVSLAALTWLRENEPKPLVQSHGYWYPARDWNPGLRYEPICRRSHMKDLLEAGLVVTIRGKKAYLTEKGRTEEVW